MVYQNMVYTYPRRYSNGNETVLRCTTHDDGVTLKEILGSCQPGQITTGSQGSVRNPRPTTENLTGAVLDKASVGNDIWRKSHAAHFAQQLVLDNRGITTAIPCVQGSIEFQGQRWSK